jgi:hypothetical protein
MESSIPRIFIFDWDITRAGTKSRIHVGLLSDATLSSCSYHCGWPTHLKFYSLAGSGSGI